MDYDKLERAELAKYKTKPAPKPKAAKPVERVVYKTDPKRKLTDKQIRKLLKKKAKRKESSSFLGIHKKAQNKKLSRKMRIRIL
ncbi:MAG: hypothetical protein WC554_11780 [Clostridia bacterium]|jgi:hypothetical protein